MSLSLAALFGPHSTFLSHVLHVILFITCIIVFHHTDMANSRVLSLFVVFSCLTSPPALLVFYPSCCPSSRSPWLSVLTFYVPFVGRMSGHTQKLLRRPSQRRAGRGKSPLSPVHPQPRPSEAPLATEPLPLADSPLGVSTRRTRKRSRSTRSPGVHLDAGTKLVTTERETALEAPATEAPPLADSPLGVSTRRTKKRSRSTRSLAPSDVAPEAGSKPVTERVTRPFKATRTAKRGSEKRGQSTATPSTRAIPSPLAASLGDNLPGTHTPEKGASVVDVLQPRDPHHHLDTHSEEDEDDEAFAPPGKGRMRGGRLVPGAGGGERVGCVGQSEKSGSTRRRCGGATGV